MRNINIDILTSDYPIGGQITGRTLKIITIIAFSFIFLICYIAHLSPVAGYELSIYDSTPLFVWVLLILSGTIGTIIIADRVISAKRTDDFWIVGLIVLLLCRFTALSIPRIRGYIAWRGDELTHIGYVKDILNTGIIPTDNSYPITHVILSEMASILNVSVGFAVSILIPVISIIFVISIYLLATLLLPEEKSQILCVAVIGLVIFNDYEVYLRPNGLSFLLIPFTIFLFLHNSTPYRVILIIYLLIYPFFHPLSSVALIMAFIVIGVSQLIIKFNNNIGVDLSDNIRVLEPTLILICIFLPWILSFQSYEPNLRLLYASITNGYSSDVLGSMGRRLDTISIEGFELVVLFLKLYGISVLFIFLSLFAGFFIIKLLIDKSQDFSRVSFLFSIFLIFLISGILYLVYLTGFSGLASIGGERFQRFLLLFTPVLVGYSLYELYKKFSHVRLTTVLILCLLVFTPVVSLYTLYDSPNVIRPGAGVTQMDISGFQWGIDHKSEDLGVVQIMSPVYRFSDYILGKTESDGRNDYSKYVPSVPNHFNYDNSCRIGDVYVDDKYAFLTQFDRIIYDTVWSPVGRFRAVDFYMLNADPSVDKIYSNGETEAHLIHSTR